MHVVFRVDASSQLGTGHVKRCLILANELLERSVKVTFMSRNLPGNLLEEMKELTSSVIALPKLDSKLSQLDWYKRYWEIDIAQCIERMKDMEGIDWLVVDHYGLDFHWEQRMRQRVKKIMVIDDLANRNHDCELLLDQNLLANMENRYDGLLPKHAVQLLGPSYRLLDKVYLRSQTVPRSHTVKRILISFGGSDPTGETKKVLQAITMVRKKEILYDVVIGSSNPDKPFILEHFGHLDGIRLYPQVPSLAPLMLKADLAIGAGGVTTWERIAMGLPSITIETADNQHEVLNHLLQSGVIYHLGRGELVSVKQIAAALNRLLAEPSIVHRMIERINLFKNDYMLTTENPVVKLLIGEEDNVRN